MAYNYSDYAYDIVPLLKTDEILQAVHTAKAYEPDANAMHCDKCFIKHLVHHLGIKHKTLFGCMEALRMVNTKIGTNYYAPHAICSYDGPVPYDKILKKLNNNRIIHI